MQFHRAVLKQAVRQATLSLVAVAIATTAFAQGVTGTLAGTVKDTQGGVVPGATVTIVSQSRGTKSAPVVTNATGDFVVPNITADTYTIRVEMPSFKVLNRRDVQISPGSRVAIGTLTIEVGGTSEVVNVTSEAPVIQASTGERSFAVTTDTVTYLPLASRSYDSLLGLAPGIQTQTGLTFASRIGGGGDSNFMLDGATAMDPGVNRAAAKVSIEAVQEVTVATSGYQAEYGRSSGLQINAVTKSGTNNFRGSVYDAERHDQWNAKSKTQILLGQPKAVQDERDWGFTAGGPVGKPGHNNKLFFFFNYERNPRTQSATSSNIRFPTDLERQGDFSATLDNNGNPYPYVKDPKLSGTCSSSSQVACFADGGKLGKIPADRLYGPGMAILNWFPKANVAMPGGQSFNYQTDPYAVALLGYQPVLRMDYQITQNLRVGGKYFMYQQPNDPIRGTIPGWNDTKEDDFGIYTPSATVNYTINQTTFFEGSWGGNYHHQEGCSVNGGSPNFCRSALQLNDAANRNLSGMGGIPYIFKDATIMAPGTLAYEILNNVKPSVWDGTRVTSVPSFTWGGRVGNSPPNNIGPFGNFILDTRTSNINLSVTKIHGAHSFKVGYYYYNSNQRRGTGNFLGSISFQNDTNNPIDTSFPFANAAVGVFNSYGQTTRWAEGEYIAINNEWYAQDNWKILPRLTLDYGLRLVHQKPQYDGYHNNSTFLPDKWVASSAPRIYVGACTQPVTTAACSAANLVARDPLTGATVATNASLLIGTLVPNTGTALNGIFEPGNGVADTAYVWPSLAVAPRTGIAWDVSGKQTFVVRGGAGLFFDRPSASAVYTTVQNPPNTRSVTLRYGTLQDLGSATAPNAPAQLNVFEYDTPLPSSVQWNGGVQFTVPFNVALDISYTGQHSYNGQDDVQINNVDLGWAYRPELQDPTKVGNTPANSLVNTNVNAVRAFQGYGTIRQTQARLWRSYHSIQLQVTRRMRNGVQFSFADTMGLSDMASADVRTEHRPDGTFGPRADQSKADELLGNQNPTAHFMKASFVWVLPQLRADSGAGRIVGLIVNDWSLSGVWSGRTGDKYPVSFSYQSGGGNLALTGSPDYAARVIVAPNVDLGGGCNSDPLRQFNTAAFRGPSDHSDGLESGNGYLTGCFQSSMDISVARTIKLGGNRTFQIRFDMFNAFNQAAITNRATSMSLNSPTDQAQILNLPFNADGSVIPARALPNNSAGFGVATAYQAPRTAQIQVRFGF
jgi:hypothetical protein